MKGIYHSFECFNRGLAGMMMPGEFGYEYEDCFVTDAAVGALVA